MCGTPARPDVPSDMKMSVYEYVSELMGVPGKKMMDLLNLIGCRKILPRKFTQDFITTSGGPTFVTPNTRENVKLQ